ncbi:carbon storage regulator [Planctomycetota bacterium]
MLVITRKINDITQIGENITVKVVKIKDGKVDFKITLLGGIIRDEVMVYNDEVQLDRDVKIKVVKIVGESKISLGISAPQDMAVVRVPKDQRINR